MWAILHIPTGTYLLQSIGSSFTYKRHSKVSVIATFTYYFKNSETSYLLTKYIPHNTETYTPDISEFEIVEVD